MAKHFKQSDLMGRGRVVDFEHRKKKSGECSQNSKIRSTFSFKMSKNENEDACFAGPSKTATCSQLFAALPKEQDTVNFFIRNE